MKKCINCAHFVRDIDDPHGYCAAAGSPEFEKSMKTMRNFSDTCPCWEADVKAKEK